MKYNININQKALAKYDIDLKDMAIFDYIHVMCASVNKNIEKERFKGHTWINYERLIEDMPALRIKSRNTISARIANLENSGLVTTEKKMINGHRRVFVKMTTQSDSVFVETSERVLSDEKRVRETVQDNYTKDNYTKNIAETSSAGIVQILESFQENEINPKNMYGNKTQRKACGELIENFGLEKVLLVLKDVVPKTNLKPRYEFPDVRTPTQLLQGWYKIGSGIQRAKDEATKLKSNVI
jgi:hypothetical protein